jgi:prevent-host-death family protein
VGTLTVTEARSILPELLDRVADGEEITITRHGEVVAVVLRPDAVRVRRAAQTIERAQEIRDLVSAARHRQLPPAGVTSKRADELVESIRAGRDRS